MEYFYSENEEYQANKFDPFIVLNNQNSPKVVEMLLSQIKDVEARKRNRKQKDRENLARTVEAVVANALRVWGGATKDAIHYSRKTGGYSKKNYFPNWLGHQNLVHAIDSLGTAGLLKNTLGDNGDQTAIPFQSRPQSTFKATDKLINICRDYGVSSLDFHKSLDAPVLFLKDGQKQLVSFETNRDDLKKLDCEIRRYNSFVAGHKFALKQNWPEVSNDQQVLRRADDLDPTQAFLYRVFNNGSWEEGGRYFGGWWQGCPSLVRPYILIHDEQTIELDYSGFLTRAIYHWEGIDYQCADPYELSEVSEAATKQKMNLAEVRRSIKKLMNILICAREDQRIGRFDDLRLPEGYGRPNAIYSLLKEKHKSIAHLLRTGIGLQMMFKESDICSRIIAEGMDKGILVLPIHDSFLVQKKHEAWLRSAMASYYREIFGFDPVIKGKTDNDRKVDKEFEAVGQFQEEVRIDDSWLAGPLELDPLRGEILGGYSYREAISSLNDLPSDQSRTNGFSDDKKARLWFEIASGGPSAYDPMR